VKSIYLDAEDDIHSICDRLDWSGAEQVLFVLPKAKPGMAQEADDTGLKGLDLVRLRRLCVSYIRYLLVCVDRVLLCY